MAATPFLFNANKNNLRPLPQRFEYNIIDGDHILLGDALIDFTQFHFIIENGSSENEKKILFQWPSALLSEGQITIKNNSGKAILTFNINKNEITQTLQKFENEELNDDVRNQLATYTTEEIPNENIDEMKYSPYMVLCVFKQDNQTNIYLCSKEIYLNIKDGKIAIESRNNNQKSPEVFINGKQVGNQGMIYLNNPNENINFRAFTQTGAFIEVETRMKEVNFVDVIQSKNPKKILVIADGAQPVNLNSVKQMTDHKWRTTLNKSRPYLFLKGDGDIPLRQEFSITGPLPTEKIRPYLISQVEEKTYSDKVDLKVRAAQNTQVINKDPLANLTLNKDGTVNWTINDILINTPTTRLLTIRSENIDFTIEQLLHRRSANWLYLSYLTDSQSNNNMQIAFQRWLSNLIFGWDIQYQLATKDKMSTTHLEILARFKKGFHHYDETAGVSLFIDNLNSTIMTQLIGLGYWQSFKFNSFLANWLDLKFQTHLTSSNSDFKLKASYLLQADAFNEITTNHRYSYGFIYKTIQFNGFDASTQLGINLGYQFTF